MCKYRYAKVSLVSTYFYVCISFCPVLRYNVLLTVFINQFLF